MRRFPRTHAATLAAAATVVTLTACGGGSHKVVATAPPSPTPSVTPAPSPKPPPNVSPLTGLPGGRGKPVLVVKIDNTAPAHPQVGINAADVVYLEQVEGGLTRLAAVFSSAVPPTVGPVRSARQTDIDLFSQYGKVAYTYSGGQPAVVAMLHRANLYLEPDGYGGGWFRGGGGRHAPYNLFAAPGKLLSARPHAAKVHDIGFRFGPMLAGMRPSAGFDAYFGHAQVTWRWRGARHGYVLSMDGSAADVVGHGQIVASNVIVQYVSVVASKLHDVNHNVTPYTHTVGHGSAVFFRDGHAVTGTWSRRTAHSGTTWMVGRKRYPMRPGRTWIILVPTSSRIRFA
ncbi:MAG: DUF3048 domain-containing protein [Actinomycetes bacterium]